MENLLPADQFAEAQEILSDLFPDGEIRRILLVAPPEVTEFRFRHELAKKKRYPNFMPYGLGVIATRLREVGVEVEICNLHNELLKAAFNLSETERFSFKKIWESKLSDTIQKFKPDLVGISCMFTMTHVPFKEVCDVVKALGVPVAAGGVHVTNDITRILRDVKSIDIVFLREPEIAVQNFIKIVHGEMGIENLKQVILREKETSHSFSSEVMPDAGQIDTIPSFDLMKITELSVHGNTGMFTFLKPQNTRDATVLSNRGCRAKCTFCSVRNFNGVGVRQRSISSVIEELRILRNEYGVSHFMWLDDDLLRDHRRAIELFNAIVRHGLEMTWDATNGVIAASCTDEVIEAAAASGCIGLNIGVESGNREILRVVKKPGTIETFLKASEILRRFEKIYASVFLIIGFPGETLSKILDTLHLAREMNLDWHGISTLQPLPNTQIYNSMVDQGLVNDGDNTEEKDYHNGVYSQIHLELQEGKSSRPQRVEDVISELSMNEIPTPNHLADISFYMNFYLNFDRLARETRPEKIRQQILKLRYTCDVVAPDNALALYFLAILENRAHGRFPSQVISRLTSKLESSEYWRIRFDEFGLAVEDLEPKWNYRPKLDPNVIFSAEP